MSDKLPEIAKILDDTRIRPVSDFSILNPNTFRKTDASIDQESKDPKMTIDQNKIEIKVNKTEGYNESVNEVVKSVVVRAKVEADRSNNKENIARYNLVVDFAIDNSFISRQELELRSQEEKLRLETKNDIETAESVLNKVDSIIARAEEALKNIEKFQPESVKEIYFVGMKLQAMLELKLDSNTLNEIQNALKRINNVIGQIESKVKYNETAKQKSSESKSPLNIFSGLILPLNFYSLTS